MPFFCPVFMRPITQEEFALLDYQVMRLAFDCQNALGRLCNETIYHNDLAARIEAAGLGSVRKEVPVLVTYRDFIKRYSFDLVLEGGVIYELKTAKRLNSDHESQLLNYLFLWGAQHGKLVNFRPANVESRFVNSALTHESRRRFQPNTERWRKNDHASEFVRDIFLELLTEWGAFLELPLYMEGLIHFLGGEEKVVRMVPLLRNGVQLGNQRMHLINDHTAFRLIAMTDTEDYERQLQSLFCHSPLSAVQWINMDRHNIQFITLER